MRQQADDVFEAAVEAAWTDFRRTLADWIDELEAQESLTFSLSGEEDDDSLEVMHHGTDMTLFIDVLDAPDPGFLTVAPGRVDELAVACVRAIRDHLQAPHPSFLVCPERTWSPTPWLRRQLDRLERPQAQTASAPPLAWPSSGDELDRLVDVALLPFFSDLPTRDSDGELPIETDGGGGLYLRSRPDGRLLQLYSFVVCDIPDEQTGLREAARLNEEFEIVKFRFSEGTLQAVVDHRTWPFVADNVRGETAAFIGFLEDQGPRLAAKLGGRTWRGERVSGPSAESPREPAHAEGRPAPLSESAAAVRQRLLQLEAAAGAGVVLHEADVAAVCRRDADLIMALIEHEESQDLAWAQHAARSAPGAPGADPDEHRVYTHERVLTLDRLRLLRLALHDVLTSR